MKSTIGSNRYAIGMLVLLFLSAALAACGGGGGGTSQTTPGMSTGVVTGFGSVIVNGTEFEVEKLQQVRIDDNPKGIDDLKVGMTVKVEFEKDTATGTRHALEIEAEAEVRGQAPAVIGGTSFTLMGQTITVNAKTVFDNTSATAANLAPLQNQFIEVSGIFTGLNAITATRIKVEDQADFEVKGVVGNWDNSAKTFKIGPTLTVSYGSFALPAGFDNAAFVQVKGTAFDSGTNTLSGITSIKIEDVEREAEGLELEVKGGIDDVNSLAKTFFVLGSNGPVRVHWDNTAPPNTRFDNGSPADIAVGTRVEVEGTMQNGTLEAREIEFEFENEVENNVKIQGLSSGTGPLSIFGLTVDITGITVQNGPLTGSDNVLIRGKAGLTPGTVIATKVTKLGSLPDSFLQGPVIGFFHTAGQASGQMTILSAADNNVTAGAATEYKNHDNRLGTGAAAADAFFRSIVPGVTVVKARANGTSFTPARELEIDPQPGG